MTNPARAARDQAGLSQPAFALAYHIPLGTLRRWEQGKRKPDAAATALLQAIQREPVLIRDLLAG